MFPFFKSPNDKCLCGEVMVQPSLPTGTVLAILIFSLQSKQMPDWVFKDLEKPDTSESKNAPFKGKRGANREVSGMTASLSSEQPQTWMLSEKTAELPLHGFMLSHACSTNRGMLSPFGSMWALAATEKKL